ncbi:transposase [Micromonospora pattaloongensis]|uniref:transposase n=1 Tax=Micromonospora pattaloongensis TaxID=405436 RepID=UPI003CCBB8C0
MPDGLWQRIEPLLPKPERNPWYPGRKRIPDRQVLCAILFVLHTGRHPVGVPAWGGDGLSVTDKDAEIARLRREVAELRQEETPISTTVGNTARRGCAGCWRAALRVLPLAASEPALGARAAHEDRLAEQTKTVHADSGGAYGSPRVTRHPQRPQFPANRSCAARPTTPLRD